MAEQLETLEQKTPSDGTSTSETKTGATPAKQSAKQPPSKVDAFGILLSALSVMRTAGIDFGVASQDGKAYLVIENAEWSEHPDGGIQVK